MANQIKNTELNDIKTHEEEYTLNGQIICHYCNGDCNGDCCNDLIWHDDIMGNCTPFCSKECKLKNDDFIKSMDDSRFNDPGCFGGNEFCSECGYNELYVCCDFHLCAYCNNKCSNGCK